MPNKCSVSEQVVSCDLQLNPTQWTFKNFIKQR